MRSIKVAEYPSEFGDRQSGDDAIEGVTSDQAQSNRYWVRLQMQTHLRSGCFLDGFGCVFVDVVAVAVGFAVFIEANSFDGFRSEFVDFLG